MGQLSETVTGKYQCQFIVGIEEERKFKVMRKLLGPSGANMRAIVDRTGAKLRLRGKGSRFLEGPDQVESSDPLMLCISVTDRRSYDVAVSMAWALMERVHQEYRGFCFRSGREVPELHVQVHDDACVLVFNASVCDRQASHRLCIAEFARAPVFLGLSSTPEMHHRALHSYWSAVCATPHQGVGKPWFIILTRCVCVCICVASSSYP